MYLNCVFKLCVEIVCLNCVWKFCVLKRVTEISQAYIYKLALIGSCIHYSRSILRYTVVTRKQWKDFSFFVILQIYLISVQIVVYEKRTADQKFWEFCVQEISEQRNGRYPKLRDKTDWLCISKVHTVVDIEIKRSGLLVGIMGWYYGLVLWVGLCVRSMGRDYGLGLWVGIMGWYYGLVLWVGIMGWYYGLVLSVGIMGWYYGLVLWVGIIGWDYGLGLWVGIMGWDYWLVLWVGIMGWEYGLGLWVGIMGWDYGLVLWVGIMGQ